MKNLINDYKNGLDEISVLLQELRAYTSLGRNNAIKFGEKIEAKVKIGRSVLWDRKKVDQYFDSLTGVK